MKDHPSLNFSFTNMFASKADQWAALLVTGYKFLTQGRLKEASRIFEGLVVLDSHNPYIQGILGSIYQKQQQYELALIRYSNALELNPDDISSLCNRGEILLKLGKFQQAAMDLKSAIEQDPDKKDGAANRARLLVSIMKDAITLTRNDGVEALEKAARANVKIDRFNGGIKKWKS